MGCAGIVQLLMVVGEGSGEEEGGEDQVVTIQDLLPRIVDIRAAAAAHLRQQKAGDLVSGLERWVVLRLVIRLEEGTKRRIRLWRTDKGPLGDSRGLMTLEKAARAFVRRLVSQLALQVLALGQPDGGSGAHM